MMQSIQEIQKQMDSTMSSLTQKQATKRKLQSLAPQGGFTHQEHEYTTSLKFYEERLKVCIAKRREHLQWKQQFVSDLSILCDNLIADFTEQEKTQLPSLSTVN
jgi:hypothetical protein